MIFCSFSTVKLCQDFIAEARDESLLQDTYQIAAYGRRMAPSNRNGKRNKSFAGGSSAPLPAADAALCWEEREDQSRRSNICC